MIPNYPAPKAVAVKLTTQGERAVKADHPWVFSKNIKSLKGEVATGDKAIIFDQKKNKFLGLGLIDLESPIRIKVLYPREKTSLDEAFFTNKLKACLEQRQPLFDTTNAYRWVFGENDGLPSLIVDVYDKVVVIKLYSGIWLPYLSTIVDVIPTLITCKAMVIRMSRMLQEECKNQDIYDGAVIFGELKDEVVVFQENHVHFSANVIHGHKTGYFLDHRQNRIAIGKLSRDKRVLDVFSYAGGFSVHALANRAKKVVSVDISGPALKMAQENASRNGQFSQHECRKGDAFAILEKAIHNKERYDVVVIDPPSFAKKKEEIETAKKQYARLANLGSRLVAKNGLLLLASCSSRITADDFFTINQEVLDKQNKRYTLEQKTFHDIDHPIGFPEGAYLKSGYYRFRD